MTAMSQTAPRTTRQKGLSALQTIRRENTELRRLLVINHRQRCVYCGTITYSRARVCHGHSDLPALDAGYHGPT